MQDQPYLGLPKSRDNPWIELPFAIWDMGIRKHPNRENLGCFRIDKGR